MRIVVTHLTRMVPGFICVAGVDLTTGKHVRPISNYAMLPLRWASTHGGPFGIGNVVELGPVKPCGKPPEIEDHHFHERNMCVIRREAQTPFWHVLESMHDTRLLRIFGRELRLEGRSCVTDAGHGAASLGCLRPAAIGGLTISRHGGVRLEFQTGLATLDLSVSDLRFYRMDDASATWVADCQRVARIETQLRDGAAVLLTVGLTRAFQRSSGDRRLHWLQVNNIHLEDDPLGDGVPSHSLHHEDVMRQSPVDPF